MSTENDALVTAVNGVNVNLTSINTGLENLRTGFDNLKDKINEQNLVSTNKTTNLETRLAQCEKDNAASAVKLTDIERIVWRIVGGLLIVPTAIAIVAIVTKFI
jgi:uncharacterized coiled-coil DUF342 family protein